VAQRYFMLITPWHWN